MLIPKVVGFKLSGAIPTGVTATDVVLTITEMLRKHGVVGKFVEFYGAGVASVPLANRATIGNMSPEFGSTAAMFPIDDVTLDYLRLTGRSEEQVALVEAYSKLQKLWHDADSEPVVQRVPRARPRDGRALDRRPEAPAGPHRAREREGAVRARPHELRRRSTTTSSTSRAPSPSRRPTRPATRPRTSTATHEHHHHSHAPASASKPTKVTLADGQKFTLDHGAVTIAAITSCTNTSNPSVMLAAGLLARNAVKKGLKAKPWVKTTLAPGSKVVTDYYEKAGLTEDLEDLGFYTVGYGCTTCIGNSGPLIEEVSAAVNENDLAVTAVLSGNRNFEGRINPDVKMNYLASPPLVIAYALAGSMNFDFETDALGTDRDGNDVFLKDIWPDAAEVQSTIDSSINTEMFTHAVRERLRGRRALAHLPTPTGATFEWDAESTYVRKPPYFDGMTMETTPVTDIAGARVLAKLGDSVTTDHISPAGNIKADSPAGQYLAEHGVDRKDFNSYGSRRGNHEVMIRGTFANIRLKNQLLDGVEGGYTRDFTQADAPQSFIYDASQNYQAAGIPLVIFGGKEYGSGSSRDWAAKGTSLLGVKAVITESFERIHRSNLIGMGVVPLQFPAGETADSLGLDGTESSRSRASTQLNDGVTPKTVHVVADAERALARRQADRRVRRGRAHRHPRRGGLLPQRRHPAVRAAQPRLTHRARSGRSARSRPPRIFPALRVPGVDSIRSAAEAARPHGGITMTLLETISGPRDLDALSPEQLEQLAAEIREFLVGEVSKTGGHLGPNLGVVELTIAIHRVFDSPRDAIVFDTGHQSYVHKLLTGRQDFVDAAPDGRPRRLPAALGVASTTSSRARTRRARCRGPTASRGLRDDRPGRPPRRRRRRRRRAHRRHDVGGAQQHQRRQHAQPRHRRQRQRPLLRADHRRHGALPQHGAHQRSRTATCTCSSRRAFDRLGAPGARVLPRRARRPARLPQPVHQQRGALLQPRHQVHRPGRRARPARDGGGPPAGEGLRRPGDRARDHREGPRLRAGSARRRRPVPRGRARSTPRPASRSRRPRAPSWTSVFADELVRARRAERAHRRHHRGDAAPDGPAPHGRALPGPRLRRRHRRAARRDVGRRPRLRRPASGRRRLRDVHQPRLRPGADGCRAAQGRRHVRARPRRRHRPRRPEPPRHVGPRDPAGRARHPHRRAARRRRASREELGEAVAVDDAPDRAAVPEGQRRRRVRRRAPHRRRRRRARARPAARTCCIVTVGPMAEHRPAGRRAARGPGHRRDGRRPALGRARAARASSTSRASTASS